jgi:magnesium chelatase subunit D
VHRVERDGISHEHPARFVLLGSMNPEEGELRPQLLDRFGLSVEVRSPVDPALRAEAVWSTPRQRLASCAASR